MSKHAKRTTYALSVDNQVGRYDDRFPTSAEAMRAAYCAVRHDGAQTVTVLRVEQFSGETAVRITGLCTVTPPITPPSTSPEVPHE